MTEADPKAAPPTDEPARPVAPPAPAPEKPVEEEWDVRYKYLLAEFDNFRKRIERERERVRQEARGLLLRELLPLYESFERAHEASTRLAPNHPFRQGLDLVRQEWERFLVAQRIEPVAKTGEPFRAEEHEAVGDVPAGPAQVPGTIAEIVQQGYRSAVGLLRPAKVLVIRPKDPPKPEPGGSVTSPP